MIRNIWSCSCIGYPTGPLILRPGETGEYPLSLSLLHASGPIKKSFTLQVVAEFPE